VSRLRARHSLPPRRSSDLVRTLGLAGLSVTMPHKAAVHDAVDERTPVAAALGAVNCVYWRGDRLVGDNTDGAGFLDALRADEGRSEEHTSELQSRENLVCR